MMRTKEQILEEIKEVEKEREVYDWGSYASDCCGADLLKLVNELNKVIANQ
jgi:hypothetical protein